MTKLYACMQELRPAALSILNQIEYPRRFGPDHPLNMALSTQPYHTRSPGWIFDLCFATKKYRYSHGQK